MEDLFYNAVHESRHKQDVFEAAHHLPLGAALIFVWELILPRISPLKSTSQTVL
jgi:hypothetical protein